MPLVLTRKPRSANAAKKVVKDEVRAEWERIAAAVIEQLNEFVATWENKPVFTCKITLGKDLWKFAVKWDRRTVEGRIFGWVNYGTSGHGDPAGDGYVIRAKKADMLHFYVPNMPSTLPGSEGAKPTVGNEAGSQEDVFRKEVFHHGVRPRKFTEWIIAEMRKPGGFQSRTNNAMKRGLRKLGS